MQAGTKGNFTHSSGIPSRFASLHDVPCMLPPDSRVCKGITTLPRSGDTKASEQQATILQKVDEKPRIVPTSTPTAGTNTFS